MQFVFSISCAYNFGNDFYGQKMRELYACQMISSPISKGRQLKFATKESLVTL